MNRFSRVASATPAFGRNMFGSMIHLLNGRPSRGGCTRRARDRRGRLNTGLRGELLEKKNLCAALVAADFGWAMDIGLSSDSDSHHIAADSQGNVYVTGAFFGTLDFDPGPDTRTLTSATETGSRFSNPDIFLAKFSSGGQFIWLKQFGAAGSDSVRGICVDIADNVTIAGQFHGQVDFDPGANTSILTADANYSNVFVVQMSASGDFKWARQFEGVGDDETTSLAVDPSGNLLISGTFYSSCDFDPGPASAILNTTTGTTGTGFVVSLTSAGDFRWVRQYSGIPTALAVDANGNALVAGTFYSSMRLDPSDAGRRLLSSNGSGAAYVIQLTNTGQLSWARHFGGTSGSYSSSATGLALAVDSQRNVLLGGYFKGTAGFDSAVSALTFASNGNTDGVLMKWTPTGSLVWADRFGSVGYDRVSALAVTNGDRIVAAGEFEFTVDFDVGSNLETKTSAGGEDSFVLGLAADGSYRWVQQFGGLTAATYAASMAVRAGQDVLLAGVYVNDVYSLPGSSLRILHPRGSGDATSINSSRSGGDRSNSSGNWGGYGMLVHDTVLDSVPAVTLAVSPASVTEDVATNLAYTFTRTAPTTSALTVNYTVGGTATLGTDYTGISATGTTATVTFAAGSATATVTVDPTADTTAESDETVILTLVSGTGYTIGTTTPVTGTITNTNNDLPAISLAVSPASVTEDGTTNLVYTFTRTGPTASALAVNYTVGGIANLGTDYTGISATGTTATVTFAAGSATATVIVDPTVDTIAESDETVILTLASGTGYTIGTTTPATGTINNVDLTAIITVAPASADKAEGKGSAPTPFTFTVTRTGVLTGASSVAWAAAGSGASQATAADFANRRLPSGTVTFSAGETTKTITVNVVADSLAEPDEGFTVTLSLPSGATLGVPSQAAGTIRAPAPPKPPQRPIVQALPRVIVAGPAAPVSRGTDAVFVVTLSSPAGAGKSITVNYTTLNGSAKAGQHYTPTKASLVFTGQETTKTIFVPTNIDSATRPFKPDRFSLRLTSAPGAKIAGSVATATIAPIPLGLAISDVTLEEGNAGTKQARFVVTLGTPSDQPVTVDYATADGSAYVTDGDFTAIPKTTLTFTPGDKPYKIVTVDVAGDTTSEGNEIFFVNLSNASGAAITKATGTATIRNDDSAAKTASEFQIMVDYATSAYGAVPLEIRAICEKVAKRWSEVIVGDLPSVNDPALGFVDDFRMTVTMGLLGSATGTDKENNTLANAKPLSFRKDGAKLPWLGITGIDPADTNPQLLESTLLHEFGHALGLDRGVWVRNNLVLSLTDGPIYVGQNAIREFNMIYGEHVRGIPLEKNGGEGTAGAHWSEAVMKTELMTGFAGPGTFEPLSKITVGALADIGYQVDYARADPFTRPAGVTVPSYASGGLPNGGGSTGGGSTGGGSAPLRGGQPAALFAAAGTLSQTGPTAVKSAVFASYRRRTAIAG